MGGYIWYPEDENVEAYKNVLFYFNGMEGNGSSRFNILRKLQQDYTDFTILQMDYPGFGLSYNVPLTLKSLKEECSFVMREILTSNPVEKYSCWGEGLGNWVMLSCLDSYPDYDPEKIKELNETKYEGIDKEDSDEEEDSDYDEPEQDGREENEEKQKEEE